MAGGLNTFFAQKRAAYIGAIAYAGLATSPVHANHKLPLADALVAFSSRTGLSLLYDPIIVPRRPATLPAASKTPEQGLEEILKGSGLTFRRAGTAAFAILPAPPEPVSVPAPPRPAPLPVADIVVIGNRGFNADIPRSQDGIQPYRLISGDDIENAQKTDLEDVLRSTLTMNEQVSTLAQLAAGNGGFNRSQIDLRGLDIYHTLVLVDGRRLPSFPQFGDFLQPDINGLPSEAIARIETLASTAGGIYGPGATGGVVNIVLKRDYHGISMKGATGITDRGDGEIRAIDAHAGWTSPGGHTRVSITGAWSVREGLSVGSRGFGQSGRTDQYSNLPALALLPPVGAGLNILSYFPMQLLPQYGGGTIPGSVTHLDAGSNLTGSQLAAALGANAGSYDLSLSRDGSGVKQTLYPRLEMRSVILGVRQSITPWLEAFVDAMHLENDGEAQVAPYALQQGMLVLPGQYGSPFAYPVFVSFSTPGLVAPSHVDLPPTGPPLA